jgi:hypothetical protein
MDVDGVGDLGHLTGYGLYLTAYLFGFDFYL